jgi:hypothetical protein
LKINRDEFSKLKLDKKTVSVAVRSESQFDAAQQLLAAIGFDLKAQNVAVPSGHAAPQATQLVSVSSLRQDAALDRHVNFEMFQMPLQMAINNFRMAGVDVEVEGGSQDSPSDFFEGGFPDVDFAVPSSPGLAGFPNPAMWEQPFEIPVLGFGDAMRMVPVRTQGKTIRRTLQELSKKLGLSYREAAGKVILSRK